jgi:N-hydroxyarylamine O-acetyltransferase
MRPNCCAATNRRDGPGRDSTSDIDRRFAVGPLEVRLPPSWLESEAEFREVLRGEFELNMTNEEIDQCVAVMKIKGTGDPPHPFFA